MKRRFPFVALLLLLAACTPTPQEIVQQSRQAIDKIQDAEYTFSYSPSDAKKGRAAKQIHGKWRKAPEDTVFHVHFINTLTEGGHTTTQLYNGEYLVRYISGEKDTMQLPAIAGKERLQKENTRVPLYSSLIQGLTLLPTEEQFNDPETQIRLLPEETITAKPCYVVETENTPSPIANDPVQVSRVIQKFWIDKETYMPLQFSTQITLKIGPAESSIQEMSTLMELRVNQGMDESLFAWTPINTLENWTGNPNGAELFVGTPMPEWRMTDTEGKKHSSQNFRGRLLLLDFFFQTCQPCVAAIPTIQRMQQTYGPQGLQVLAIDPIDKNADKLNQFKAEKGISYPFLFATEMERAAFGVNSYPTVYLVDAHGKIAFVHSGYSNDFSQKLEAAIKSNL